MLLQGLIDRLDFGIVAKLGPQNCRQVRRELDQVSLSASDANRSEIVPVPVPYSTTWPRTNGANVSMIQP